MSNPATDEFRRFKKLFIYVNEFDVEGLIASAGTFANVVRKQNIVDLLNLYDQVDENLRRHDPGIPQLRNCVQSRGKAAMTIDLGREVMTMVKRNGRVHS